MIFWWLPGGSAAAGEAPAVDQAPMQELQLAIAVPLREGVRPIFVTGERPHFHVVLTNRGQATVRLWTQTCSWGYQALRFEAVDAAGKVVEIGRRPQQFLQNAPTTYALEAGDCVVFDIYFAGDDWQGFKLPAKGQTMSTRLRAIYEVPADKQTQQHNVWTGKVESPLGEYRFESRR
ncbi:MAG: hypothetical protein AB7E98_22690 [Pirellulales bacterium]